VQALAVSLYSCVSFQVTNATFVIQQHTVLSLLSSFLLPFSNTHSIFMGLFLLSFFFLETESHHVAQAGLKLLILLPQTPEC
jgi:hypothetical protein